EIGGTNTVEIKDGGATMIDAQCPDQLCRYMGTITDAYGLIVCLPNGVIVEGVNLAPQPEEVEIDGIS
ncbi:MAG: NusG domain II-containing protein, partial [Aeriscardovia sp.]|nr:NusG domain II-containing protein [Aeriscardovia sp.]